jgi:ElaA protein
VGRALSRAPRAPALDGRLTARGVSTPVNDRAPGSPSQEVRWQWLPFAALGAERVHHLLQLRQDIFVLEQRCLYRDIDGLDPTSWHGLGTTAQGELVACARLVPPAPGLSEPSIGRVAVARAWRARGLGRTLMLTAIAEARARHPRCAVLISAQAHLQHFYATLGFQALGDVYDDDGIPHRRMRLPPA